jgi:hypothetical protein
MVERVFAVQNFERQNGFFEAVIEKFFADLLVKNTNAYRVAMKMPNLLRDNLKNIKMVFDDVKFIICVRDPLTCFLSTYDHQCAILKNSPDTVDDGSRIIEFLLENKEHLNGINKEIIERMPNEIFMSL